MRDAVREVRTYFHFHSLLYSLVYTRLLDATRGLASCLGRARGCQRFQSVSHAQVIWGLGGAKPPHKGSKRFSEKALPRGRGPARSRGGSLLGF